MPNEPRDISGGYVWAEWNSDSGHYLAYGDLHWTVHSPVGREKRIVGVGDPDKAEALDELMNKASLENAQMLSDAMGIPYGGLIDKTRKK